MTDLYVASQSLPTWKTLPGLRKLPVGVARLVKRLVKRECLSEKTFVGLVRGGELSCLDRLVANRMSLRLN